mmetsp:Transcript_4926/g.17109  ORF Transcript_4926/g.17109 Transcript_4926/m.17109 type:complete len:211 (-) Transcript_4926:2308-2940(-)
MGRRQSTRRGLRPTAGLGATGDARWPERGGRGPLGPQGFAADATRRYARRSRTRRPWRLRRTAWRICHSSRASASPAQVGQLVQGWHRSRRVRGEAASVQVDLEQADTRKLRQAAGADLRHRIYGARNPRRIYRPDFRQGARGAHFLPDLLCAVRAPLGAHDDGSDRVSGSSRRGEESHFQACTPQQVPRGVRQGRRCRQGGGGGGGCRS